MFDRLADKFNIQTNVQLSPSSEPLLSAEDEETLSSVCHSVCFILGDSIDAGKGTLYLTTRWAQPSQFVHMIQIRAFDSDAPET